MAAGATPLGNLQHSPYPLFEFKGDTGETCEEDSGKKRGYVCFLSLSPIKP